MKQFNFSFINLGCNKNLVDTQFLLGNIFSIAGNNPNFEIDYIADPYDDNVDFVFLNTCGFISSGRYEMFEEIDKLLAAGKKIYLLGCALQYFETTLSSFLKEGDHEVVEDFYCTDSKKSSPRQVGELLYKGANNIEIGKRKEIKSNPNIHFLSRTDWNNIGIEQILTGFDSKIFGESPVFNGIRAYTNIDYGFEYLKIAEGCSNNCTYCIIPKIRGKQKSLPIEDVVNQAKDLVKNGVKEIILVAQDTNRYGIDLYGKSMFFELLEELEKIEGDFMYRVLYLYPDILTLKHLEKLKNLKKFIPYFDIPLQHISPEILKKMGRFYDKNHILNLLDFIDRNFKEKFIRTNIIVGFPGETEDEFIELCEFLGQYKFDNVALFEYHDEPLAESSKLDGKVVDEEIHRRFEILNGIINSVSFGVEGNETKNLKHNKLGFSSQDSSELQLKQKKGKNKLNIGYIMGFEGSEKNPTIIVRPWLHAPEIDSYDEIKLKDIVGVFSDDTGLDIGSKIQYKK